MGIGLSCASWLDKVREQGSHVAWDAAMGFVPLDSAGNLLGCQQQTPVLGAVRIHEAATPLCVAANDSQH